MTDDSTRLQSIDGDAAGLYPAERGSSPLGGSCVNCGEATENPKFCSRSCSVSYHNTIAPKRNPNKARPKCFHCNNEIVGRLNRKYCSASCQADFEFNKKLDAWKSGKESGLNANGCVKNFVKKYLRETRGDACEICGWSEVNPHTGVVPVVADHIDGDYTNNTEDNLRLLCPNCDSLQPTYKALNKGRGRKGRS